MLFNGLKRLSIKSCRTSSARLGSLWQHSAASYSTLYSPLEPNQVKVKVGSNGFVNLDIYHPPQSPKVNAPVIIYLPRGPVSPLSSVEPSSLLQLATSANTTIVRLNYRLSKTVRYPLPVHDILAGYDWIVQHLLQPTGSERNPAGKVAVCGEFIGGGLAAALALTECHTNGIGVRALFMGNPITDWTSMPTVPKPAPELGKSKTGRRKRTLPSWEAHAHSSELSASSLLRARSQLFASPEDYFDVFASPMLFFRTPPIDVPPEVDALDEIFLPPEIAALPPAKKRKAHRRHPPQEAELTMPHTKVMVGEECLLRDQGIELAEGIARSIHSYGGPMGTGEGTGWERVEVEIKPGMGVWNEKDLIEIGSTLREILRD